MTKTASSAARPPATQPSSCSTTTGATLPGTGQCDGMTLPHNTISSDLPAVAGWAEQGDRSSRVSCVVSRVRALRGSRLRGGRRGCGWQVWPGRRVATSAGRATPRWSHRNWYSGNWALSSVRATSWRVNSAAKASPLLGIMGVGCGLEQPGGGERGRDFGDAHLAEVADVSEPLGEVEGDHVGDGVRVGLRFEDAVVDPRRDQRGQAAERAVGPDRATVLSA